MLATSRIVTSSSRRRVTSRAAIFRHQKKRQLLSSSAASDNLLGHSPMSSPPAKPQASLPIPTQQDASLIWATTSTKRDALAEIKTESGGQDLDELATPTQQQELHMVDGLTLIARAIDEGHECSTEWEEGLSFLSTSDKEVMLVAEEWNQTLNRYTTELERKLSTFAADPYLRNVRNVVDEQEAGNAEGNLTGQVSYARLKETSNNPTDDSWDPQPDFERAVQRLRFHIALITAKTVLQWPNVTKLSAARVDRAAVDGPVAPPHQLPCRLLDGFLTAIVRGSDRVAAAWETIDHDGDGLLEEEELTTVCNDMLLEPTGSALRKLLEEALAATKSPDDQLGWRARRREKRARVAMNKVLETVVTRHFHDELEMDHRLRCMFVWSNKKHQDNKVDSVLVEDSGWSGRKRYVELKPKISLDEFREIQREHLPQLDSIAGEFLKSFRDSVLVVHGKGRQNAELKRDCTLFLLAISVIDYIIWTL